MSANTAGLCNSFLKEVLEGYHAFDASYRTADAFKGALYLVNESIGPATTAYGTTGEVTGTGYTAGGAALSFESAAVDQTNNAGSVNLSANVQWTGLTLSSSFDTLLVYNSSQSNRAVGAFNFGAQTITAGTLTLTKPSDGWNTSLIQLANAA